MEENSEIILVGGSKPEKLGDMLRDRRTSLGFHNKHSLDNGRRKGNIFSRNKGLGENFKSSGHGLILPVGLKMHGSRMIDLG